MNIYLIVGAPGAGKGTQAAMLAERLGVIHVASGDLLREAVRLGTPLGTAAKRYMDRGALVPDDVVIGIIAERIARPDAANGVILDGFPRTRLQCEELDRSLGARGERVTAVLYVGVREEELLRRLSGRWLCRAAGHPYHEVSHPPATPGVCDVDGSDLYQRDDDRPEKVRARLEQQLPPMYDVLDHYGAQGVLFTVDGEGSIQAVNDALYRLVASPVQPGRRS